MAWPCFLCEGLITRTGNDLVAKEQHLMMWGTKLVLTIKWTWHVLQYSCVHHVIPSVHFACLHGYHFRMLCCPYRLPVVRAIVAMNTQGRCAYTSRELDGFKNTSWQLIVWYACLLTISMTSHYSLVVLLYKKPCHSNNGCKRFRPQWQC